ncbi:MAG: hypothetical protein ABIS92_08825 [Polyangia bacterium]
MAAQLAAAAKSAALAAKSAAAVPSVAVAPSAAVAKSAAAGTRAEALGRPLVPVDAAVVARAAVRGAVPTAPAGYFRWAPT